MKSSLVVFLLALCVCVCVCTHVCVLLHILETLVFLHTDHGQSLLVLLALSDLVD